MLKFIARYKLVHVFIWLLYFIFWPTTTSNTYHITLLQAFGATLIWAVAQFTAIYTGIYFIIPQYFNKRKYWLVITYIFVSTLLVTLFILYFGKVLYYNWINPELLRTITNGRFLLYQYVGNLYIIAFFMAIKLVVDRLRTEIRDNILEKERIATELKFLKSQVNPHFLFNAINSIYVLIKTAPNLAASTLARFSDMLRYQLYECNTDDIPVEKELHYLRDYIVLEQLRKGDSVKIILDIHDNVQQFHIAPLLIIPIVENAFKYISTHTNKENFIIIKAGYDKHRFSLSVENSCDDIIMPVEEAPVGGIGHTNVRRRLQLLYPGKHTFTAEKISSNYVVLLSILTT